MVYIARTNSTRCRKSEREKEREKERERKREVRKQIRREIVKVSPWYIWPALIVVGVERARERK